MQKNVFWVLKKPKDGWQKDGWHKTVLWAEKTVDPKDGFWYVNVPNAPTMTRPFTLKNQPLVLAISIQNQQPQGKCILFDLGPSAKPRVPNRSFSGRLNLETNLSPA